MKNNTKISLLFFAVLMVGSLVFTGDALADTSARYPFLEKIPGTATIPMNDLAGYISAIYKVALVIVTLSALLMLSIGGFMYLTSAGNTSSISTAKGIIYDSLIGLVIALCAWLILYTINPDLVEITLKPLPAATIVKTELPPPTPSGQGTLPPADSIQLAQDIIANPNIKLKNSGECSSSVGQVTPRLNMQDIADGTQMIKCFSGCKKPGAAKCSEVTNISQTMLKAIWTVGQTESFTIESIAGGSHSPSSAHYQGRAIDVHTPISWQLLKAFIAAGAIPPSRDGTETCTEAYCGKGQSGSMCEASSGKNVGCTGGSGADHIHLVFPN